jgi:hypothetical protein
MQYFTKNNKGDEIVVPLSRVAGGGGSAAIVAGAGAGGSGGGDHEIQG